ncbi:MAG: type II toxin-antitoxin system RelE/ParE family toxin [Bacteroidetes bacterium]|nr:type II toxin-antitoxin system RelE/ParE family toxin [Bacteroidota bacterium]
MEIRIIWSELSVNQIQGIFEYYSKEAGSRIAKRIVNKIIERVAVLKHNPQAGQKEELLVDYPEDFRYLVDGNYKIIYWIKEGLITIASVFDCRQNPEKLKNV